MWLMFLIIEVRFWLKGLYLNLVLIDDGFDEFVGFKIL